MIRTFISRHPDETTREQMRRNALAALAVQGDRAAFEALVHDCHPAWLRFAGRVTGDADMAQTALQNAVLAMAKNIRKLRDPATFSSWAFTIIHRRCVDRIHARQNERARYSEADAPEGAYLPDPATAIDLQRALRDLPAADRQLVLLFYIGGFTGPELAQSLGVAEGTIKSRLSRIRETLSHSLNPKGGHHE